MEVAATNHVLCSGLQFATQPGGKGELLLSSNVSADGKFDISM